MQLTLQWKETYIDEYTGEVLPQSHIQAAMLDELTYFCEHVLLGVSVEEAQKMGGRLFHADG